MAATFDRTGADRLRRMTPAPLPASLPRGRTPRGGRGSVAIPPHTYWRGAGMVTLVMFAVIAVRVAELAPGLAALKPALTGGLMGFVLIWHRSGRRVTAQVLGDRGVRAAILYFGIAALSTPFALWKRPAFDALQGLAFAVLLLMAFLMIAPQPREYERMRRRMYIIVAIFGVLVSRQGLVEEGTRLSTAGSLDPNDLAAVMAAMIPLAFASLLRGRQVERLLGAVAGSAMLYVIAQTGSRGGVVALTVGLLVMLAAMDARRTVLGLAAMLVGALAMWRLGPQTFRDRVASLTSLESDYNMTTDDGRLAIWGRGLGYLKDHPILGVGPNNMSQAEGRRFEELGIKAVWRAAHNAYLQAFVELGIFGGMVFLYMIGLALRRSAAVWKHGVEWGIRPATTSRPEVLASLLTFCTAAVFLSHAYSYMLFALLGFAALAFRTFRVAPAPCHQSGRLGTTTPFTSLPGSLGTR